MYEHWGEFTDNCKRYHYIFEGANWVLINYLKDHIDISKVYSTDELYELTQEAKKIITPKFLRVKELDDLMYTEFLEGGLPEVFVLLGRGIVNGAYTAEELTQDPLVGLAYVLQNELDSVLEDEFCYGQTSPTTWGYRTLLTGQQIYDIFEGLEF